MQGDAGAGDLSAFEHLGYRVLEAVLEPAAIGRVRRRLDELVDHLGAPPIFARATRALAGHEDALVTPTGLALTRPLAFAPDLAADIVETPLRGGVGALCRAQLGALVRVEAIGATVSDATRPFFPWHTHIDGLDEGERIRAGSWPAVTRVERLLTLLYLQPLDDQEGALLVRPRAIAEPTGPHGGIHDAAWPGSVTLRAPAGSLVVLDQCTWHAAHATRSARRRMVIASSFAREDTRPAPWVDPSAAAFSAIIQGYA
jgi:hypothetical protein